MPQNDTSTVSHLTPQLHNLQQIPLPACEAASTILLYHTAAVDLHGRCSAVMFTTTVQALQCVSLTSAYAPAALYAGYQNSLTLGAVPDTIKWYKPVCLTHFKQCATRSVFLKLMRLHALHSVSVHLTQVSFQSQG